MHAIQGSFGCLFVPLLISDEEAHKVLLKLCFWLMCLCTCCVGINQIQNMYVPLWKASDDEELWENMGEMMFGDIQWWDQVS
jgi:hypothetical protein